MTKHLIKLVWRRKRANGLLILEIFVSFIVVFAVTVMGVKYLNRVRQPIGFTWDNVYEASANMSVMVREIEAADAREAMVRVLDEVRALPEVVAVAAIDRPPFTAEFGTSDFEYGGRTVGAGIAGVSDGGAAVLEITVEQGRWFELADDALDWTPVVINRMLAEQLFAGDDPLGQTISEGEGSRQQRVVGVIEDHRRGGYLSAPEPFVLNRISLTQEDQRVLPRFLLRVRPGTTAEFEERAVAMMRTVVPEWDAQIELTESTRQRNFKFRIAAFVVLALVAGFLMIMVVLGMIGVFWQSVTGRTSEIGLRRALGSPRTTVYRQLMSEIIIVTTVASLFAAILVLQLPLLGILGSTSWGVILVSLTVSLVVMYTLATFSGLYPALLAARVHPAKALHDE